MPINEKYGFTAEAPRTRPSTKLTMRGYENSARGELVEPCALCASAAQLLGLAARGHLLQQDSQLTKSF